MKKFKIINLERFIKNDTIREWVEALIIAIVIALIFRTWAYSPYRVPTGSMIPTIRVGDYLFANMHAYGFVVPFTDIKLFPSKVNRGDIIIFPNPNDPSIPYIKRAVAIEGDKVEIIGETIYINGKPEDQRVPFYDEHMFPVPYSADFRVPQSFVVGNGKIWPLGDNRRNSSDGRFWGFVDEKNVRARGMFIHWSHDPQQGFLSGYRFDRIGKWLE
jgi:signal peptidase I